MLVLSFLRKVQFHLVTDVYLVCAVVHRYATRVHFITVSYVHIVESKTQQQCPLNIRLNNNKEEINEEIEKDMAYESIEDVKEEAPKKEKKDCKKHKKEIEEHKKKII